MFCEFFLVISSVIKGCNICLIVPVNGPQKAIILSWGFGAVGIVVATDTIDLRFESQHWQINLSDNLAIAWHRKDNNTEKQDGIGFQNSNHLVRQSQKCQISWNRYFFLHWNRTPRFSEKPLQAFNALKPKMSQRGKMSVPNTRSSRLLGAHLITTSYRSPIQRKLLCLSVQ